MEIAVSTRKTVNRRWWLRYRKIGSCHVWTGATDAYGYGYMTVSKKLSNRSKSKQVRVHRVQYVRCYGLIPKGMKVLHSCDNPPCIRPSHLMLGTQVANMKDMARKLRHGMAKLTPRRVRAIRAALARGEKQKRIAARFGISESNVVWIKRGRTWQHVQ